MFGIARITGRPGAAASSSAIVMPAAIESTRVCSPSDGAADFERLGDVLRLQRDDDDVRVGHGPGRARDHPDARVVVLEDVAPVGIDLGDGDRVGLEVGVEQPGDEGFAHAPTTEQRDADHASEGTGARRATGIATLRVYTPRVA